MCVVVCSTNFAPCCVSTHTLVETCLDSSLSGHDMASTTGGRAQTGLWWWAQSVPMHVSRRPPCSHRSAPDTPSTCRHLYATCVPLCVAPTVCACPLATVSTHCLIPQAPQFPLLPTHHFLHCLIAPICTAVSCCTALCIYRLCCRKPPPEPHDSSITGTPTNSGHTSTTPTHPSRACW